MIYILMTDSKSKLFQQYIEPGKLKLTFEIFVTFQECSNNKSNKKK